MSPNSSTAQSTFNIPGLQTGSSIEQNDFDAKFRQIIQDDEQLQTLRQGYNEAPSAAIISDDQKQQDLEHLTNMAAQSADQSFASIVGGDPLLRQLDNENPPVAGSFTAQSENNLTSKEVRAQQIEMLNAVLNMTDRLSLFRTEHDVVNPV
ncbi:MAG: hypothetical protein EOO17_01120 [Chloroflexi bacterium]|nr:MAG: hypothetical protein EOO17_01120 [Chloroflexota bacterium]